MICAYSGTGNSEYVAKKIAKQLNEPYLNLFEKIKNHDVSEIHSETPFVFVCPTYGWQLPHLVRDWLKQVTLLGNKEIYFVLTCGSDIGNASKYLKQLCQEMKMNYKGCAEIIMPENYLAMFDVPNHQESIAIIQKAQSSIDQVIHFIHKNQRFPEKKVNFIDSLKSGIVNEVFYAGFVHDKKFVVSDACIGCGKCEQVCVCNNITLIDHKPTWNHHCTHCMACICECPVEAIEYGNKSQGKPRYHCPVSVNRKEK